MGKIYPAMAVLVFALLSLVGYESRAGGETNLVRVAEMQKTLRELWLGHIFMIQHVVLYNTTNNPGGAAYRRSAGSGERQTDCGHIYAVLRRSEV